MVRGRGAGSGFVVGDERWIVTNAHVVEGFERRQIVVHFASGEVIGARVVAFDPRHDLAVLATDTRAPATPLELGDSDRVQVGQSVLAFGSPHGLEGTLTQGIVSARRSNLRGVGDGAIQGLIQTDAPINPGNSGGPLVDARGQVIGVNTLIISRTGGSDGIGFAVPSALVESLLGEVRRELARRESAGRENAAAVAGGEAASPAVDETGPTLPVWLGIEGEEFAGFGMRGVRIQRVVPGGPAARAGLRGARDPAPHAVRRLGVPWTGYVILAIDGQPVRDWDDLLGQLGRHRPGERTTLTVAAPPGPLTGDTTVRLASPPREPARAPTSRERRAPARAPRAPRR
jgi:putative serine protease PepD